MIQFYSPQIWKLALTLFALIATVLTWGILQNSISKLRHPNIIKLLGICKKTGKRYLVYDLAAGGSMLDALQGNAPKIYGFGDDDDSDYEEDDGDIAQDDPAFVTVPPIPNATFSWRLRCQSLASLCRALIHSHEKGVMHRDIKPDNICFHDEEYTVLTLIDFGIATQNIHVGTSYGGTGPYIDTAYCDAFRKAREKGNSPPPFTEAQDVYSVGVLIVALLTGETGLDKFARLKARLLNGTFGEDRHFVEDTQAGDWNDGVFQSLTQLARDCLGLLSLVLRSKQFLNKWRVFRLPL